MAFALIQNHLVGVIKPSQKWLIAALILFYEKIVNWAEIN